MTAGDDPALAWPAPWVDRLRRRLGRARGPVVQIWGWPGFGKGLLLQALAETEGLEVPPAALTDPETLETAAASARDQGLAYLLCRRWPGKGFLRGLPRLTSRPLILFTGRRWQALDCRSGEDPSIETVGPRELALEPAEIGSLWSHVTGEPPVRTSVQALWQATEGWMRPVELAARAAAERPLSAHDALSLAALPSIQAFLEEEVLASIEAIEEEPRDGGGRRALLGLEEASAALVERLRPHGLLYRDAAGGLRRPPLLEALGEIHRRAGSSSSPGSSPPSPVGKAPSVGAAPEEASSGTFEIQFLGPPQVWRLEGSRRHPIAWSLRRALKIFAFLLGQPDHRATRIHLVEAAFADGDLETVRRNFHPTLSRLRRTLGDGSEQPLEVLIFREGFYELNPRYLWRVDADRFARLAESAEAHHRCGRREAAVADWQEAWKLYRGPYLDGHEEGWIIQRREALYRGYLELLRNLGDALTELDRLPAALDAYRALLVEDPLQEAVQAQVMGLYAAQGRRDLVRRQYDRLSKLLNEELGVEPLQATTLAYHRLMG